MARNIKLASKIDPLLMLVVSSLDSSTIDKFFSPSQGFELKLKYMELNGKKVFPSCMPTTPGNCGGVRMHCNCLVT